MRVVIADDSALIRDGLSRLLTEADHQVCAAVDNGDALAREVALTDPDIAIVDIRMPPTFTSEGLAAATLIRRDHPRTGVLLLSQHLESRYAMRLLTASPNHVGYLLKDRVTELDILLDALDRVVSGECVVDPAIVVRLMDRTRRSSALDVLSPREREVLALIAEGRSNQAIARRLVVSPKTLEGHIGRILIKLGIDDSSDGHRRVLAVLAYLRAPGSCRGIGP